MIQNYLNHTPDGFRLRELESVTSTNDEIKKALEQDEPEGLVVRASRQTGGYGRQGRTWASPVGGLYQSLLLRPHVEAAALPTLSLVVSIAARRALVELTGCEALQVKWPNDLVVNSALFNPRGEATGSVAPHNSEPPARTFHKLCGISLEVHRGGVCVGMGVNVLTPQEGVAVGGKNMPVYLDELARGITPSQAGDAFLHEFGPLYSAWQQHGFEPFLQEYTQHLNLLGMHVSMQNQKSELMAQGIAVSVDIHGRLVLQTPEGALIPVISGEAHLC